MASLNNFSFDIPVSTIAVCGVKSHEDKQVRLDLHRIQCMGCNDIYMRELDPSDPAYKDWVPGDGTADDDEGLYEEDEEDDADVSPRPPRRPPEILLDRYVAAINAVNTTRPLWRRAGAPIITESDTSVRTDNTTDVSPTSDTTLG